MNRHIRRRQKVVAVKAQKRLNRRAAPAERVGEKRSAVASPLPHWRRALMTTAALTGVVGLLPHGATAQTFTATPTAGDDNTVLTALPDGTAADLLAGNDTVTVSTAVGVSGSATVTGGADNDSITLTSGSYLGQEGEGSGQVLGDAGDDTIRLTRSYVGNEGSGTVSGGDGNDEISLSDYSKIGYGNEAVGQVLGDAGDDLIDLDRSGVGSYGFGTVSGGEGNDTITLHNRSYLGGLSGGAGQVLGDAGDDSITLDNSRVGYVSAGTVDGGAGADTIELNNNTHIGRYSGSRGQVLGGADNDTITLDQSFVGFEGAGTVDGGEGADSITVRNNSAIGRETGATGQVLGGADNDTITLDNNVFVGVNGAATVDGGEGNDSITLSTSGVVGMSAGGSGHILGDAGDDTIIVADYSVVGSSGVGIISGGDGNDSIALSNNTSLGSSAGGEGQLLGDAGDDTIMLDQSLVGSDGAGTVSGGEGNDSIALSNNSHIGWSAGATGQVLGDAGEDTIVLDSSRVGSDGAGTVSGGEGNDSIVLGNGSDIGSDSDGSGQVLGGAGDDTISLDDSKVGQNGAGAVSGGEGNDSIILSNSSDVGYSSSASNQVLGDAGDDTIILDDSYLGLFGSGTVSGGEGNDSIMLRGSSHIAAATYSGAVFGDAGDDTIILDGSYVGRMGAATVSGGEGNDSIRLSNQSVIGVEATGTGGVLGDAGDDTITIDDSIIGRDGAGMVDGGEGNDSITLSNGSDLGEISGSTGQVFGGAGDDTITLDGSDVALRGAGTVSGGEGNDSITLSNSSNIGRISGTGHVLGDAGDDTITLDDSYVGRGSDGTLDGGDGNDSITLSNRSHVGAQQGVTGHVLGGAGDDTITLDSSNVGRSGAGTVSGGAGNDSIVLRSGSRTGESDAASGAILGDAGDDTITIYASVIGVSGGATVDGGEGSDVITLTNSAEIGAQGQVLGGAGDDTVVIDETLVRAAGSVVDGGDGVDALTYRVAGDATFPNAPFTNFETFRKDGTGTLTVTKALAFSNLATVTEGVLDLSGDGALTSAAVTVEGGVLRTDGGALASAADVSVATAGRFEVNGDEAVAALMNDGAVEIAGGSIFRAGMISNNAGGVINLGAGATLEGTGNTLNNASTINVAANGALVDAGDINNLASGVINFADGGGLAANGANGFVNEGALNLAAGDLAISGAVENSGVLDIAGGSVFRAGAISNNAGGIINLGAGAMLEGTGNTLSNASTINVAAGGSLMDAGDINNLAAGVINFADGGAVASGGANGFTNAGAVNLLAGSVTVDGDLANSGTITFAQDTLQTVTVSGGYVQTPDGVLSVNIVGDASDQLVVAGDVELAGELNIASVSGIQTGENAIEIINATGDVSGGFDVASGLLIDQSVSIDGGDVDVVLNVTVKPVADLTNLSGNQTRIGENLFAVLADTEANKDLAGVAFAIGLLENEAELAAAFGDLHPESLDIGLKFLTASQRNFVDLMFEESQHTSYYGEDGGADGVRVWGGVQASGYNQDGGAHYIGFDGGAYDFAAGVSGYRIGRFILGFAGAYGEYNGEGDGSRGDDVDAQIFRLAASARLDIGGEGGSVLGHLSGVVSYAGGETDYEMSRIAGPELTMAVHEGSVDIDSFDAAARFTLDGLNGKRWPVSPYVELGVNAYSQNDATIGAGGITAIVVDDLSNTRGHVGLGARYDHQLTDRMSFNIRAAGVHYFGDTRNAFTSRFVLAPDDVPGFRTIGREINRQVEFDASMRYSLQPGLSLEASAFGETGDLDVYGARLSISKTF